jgi:hypothetical protein
MRTHPCVRLFCIVDTLTSASVLPGIDGIIDEAPTSVVRSGHDHMDNMSSQVLASFAMPMTGAVRMCKSVPILTSLASAGALQICRS